MQGLRDVQRALKSVAKDEAKELRLELAKAGEGVRSLAQSKAESNISHIGAKWARGSFGGVGAPWARMRLGVTTSYVYIAPASRRHGGSPRPNLGSLLVTKAMVPAAQESHTATVLAIEGMLDRITVKNGFH